MPLTSIEIFFDIPKFPQAREKKFTYESWHLREIFVSRLRDHLHYELDGLDHLNIDIVQKPVENPYRREVTTTWNGSTTTIARFSYCGFDISDFFAGAESERSFAIINVLESSVSELANLIGTDAKPIHEAAEFTRQCGPLTTMSAPSHWPWHELIPEATTASGEYHGRLVREVGLGHCQWQVEVLDKSGTSLSKVDIPEQDAQSFYRFAECNGNLFRLLDQNRKVTFELNLVSNVAP